MDAGNVSPDEVVGASTRELTDEYLGGPVQALCSLRTVHHFEAHVLGTGATYGDFVDLVDRLGDLLTDKERETPLRYSITRLTQTEKEQTR